jgi:hypothetical protein
VDNDDGSPDPAVDALVAEAPVEAMDDVTPAPAESHRARTIVSTVLGVLTVLVLVVSVVAVWARATVLNGDKLATLVGHALDEPEVQAGLADRITTEVFTAADVQNRLTEALPAQLQRFAPAIAAGAQQAVERALTDVLGTERVNEMVERLIERAHKLAINLLEGDGLGDGVTIKDGVVTLNLLPLIDIGLSAVQEKTGLLSDVTLPDLEAGGDPQQQIAALSSAINRPLPADFGQLVVYRSEALANAQENLQLAQRLLVLSQRAVWLLVVLFVVLATATILVAARRWRAALVLGIGAAGAMVLLRSATREVVDRGPDIVSKAGAKAATRVILEGVSTGLLRLAGVMLLIGLVTAAVAVVVRKQWRADLILVAAVAIGVAIPAAIGLNIWSALIGLVVGIAVPFLANWLLPDSSPKSGTSTAAVAG